MSASAEKQNGREGLVARSPEKIKVLMYHRVVEGHTPLPDEREFCIEAKVFRNHLRILEKMGFTTITFEDYHLYQEGKLNLPKKPIIVTFDDGYRDTYEIAYPVLKEFGMRAVVFVLGDPNVRMNDWDSGYEITPAPLMTPAQIFELHAAGFEIGSHSLTHPRLTQIPRDQAWEEVMRSRMLLEILINAPVRTFSYPYGLVDDTARRFVREAGYLFGCGVYSGPASFGADPFDIRRISPSVDILPLGFWLQVITPYERLNWLKWKTGKMIRRVISNENGATTGQVQ